MISTRLLGQRAKAELLKSNRGESERRERLRVEDYQGKIWVARPRPDFDRVSSAWLIRNFIDPKAKFVFADKSAQQRGALPYDMLDSKFGHFSMHSSAGGERLSFGVRSSGTWNMTGREP